MDISKPLNCCALLHGAGRWKLNGRLDFAGRTMLSIDEEDCQAGMRMVGKGTQFQTAHHGSIVLGRCEWMAVDVRYAQMICGGVSLTM